MSDNIADASTPQLSNGVEYPSQSDYQFHVLSISPGKDIISELKSISEKLESDLHITSGIGTIDHADMAFGTIKGSHQLINLNGAIFATGESEVSRISATLLPSGGGDMMGGPVTGTLIASSDVQVILLSSPSSTSEPDQSFLEGNSCYTTC